MADNTVFAFDTSPFERGIKKIGNGMAGLQQGIGNMAKSVSKGVMSAVAKIGLIALAYKGVKAALREMPEIGKTFEMAKNVIFKNLFYPLRKAIFPLLQKFLNWVRDNRSMFVRWGQALVGIFNSITSTVSRLIEFGQSLGETFKGLIEKTFGAQIKTFGDFINLMTFKFAVLLEFIMSVLKPIIKFVGELFDRLKEPLKSIGENVSKFVNGLITANKEGHSLFTVVEKIAGFFGDIINFISRMTSSFLEGFVPAIREIMTPISEIVDAFKDIFNSIFGSNEAMKGWEELFKFLGDTIGKTLVEAFKFIGDAVKFIGDTIKTIKDAVQWLIDNDVFEILFPQLRAQRMMEEEYKKRGLKVPTAGEMMKIPGLTPEMMEPQNLIEWLMPQAKLQRALQDAMKNIQTGQAKDALITKSGEIIKFAPGDNILASKNIGGMGGVSVSIDFKGMNINVQQATQAEAEKFGESIVDTIRTQLNMELERAGAT